MSAALSAGLLLGAFSRPAFLESVKIAIILLQVNDGKAVCVWLMARDYLALPLAMAVGDHCNMEIRTCSPHEP